MVKWWNSLRFRIALLFTALLTLVLATSFVLVSAANLGIFEDQAVQELETGERVFRRLLQSNDRQLIQATQVLVADFAFRTAMATADGPTMLSVLRNHGNRLGAELTMLSDLQGVVSADSLGLAKGGRYPFPDLMRQALLKGEATGLRLIGGKAYQLVVVPVKAPVVIGWVTMGVQLTAAMAQDLRTLSGLEVTIMQQGARPQALVSTLPADMLAALLALPGGAGNRRLELAGGAPYQTRVLPLAGQHGELVAVLQRSLREIMLPFYELQRAMLLLGGVSLLLCVLASLKVSSVVTHPVLLLARVAEKVREGSYSQRIVRPDTHELATLADSLDHMQKAISEREQEILSLAYRDTLTGLENRAGFLRELEHRIGFSGQPFTVMLLDLDRFQQLNDTLGHAAGDHVIIRVAAWLQPEVVHEGGVLARLGGDEFAFLLPSCEYQEVLNAVLQGFERQLAVDDKKLDVRASIGIACYPQHASDAQNLLRCADEAMYVAKRRKSVFAVYDAVKRQFREEHLSLLGDLKRALEQEQLALYYQPKVALNGSGHCEAEALVRWQHPQRGFIPPGEFIPFAEQTGYIREITHWAVMRGCIDAAQLLAEGHPVRVSVNLSTRDLLNPALPEFVASCLEMSRLPKRLLCLEITESGVMDDPDRALETLHALRALGIALAIDDYGTGYSSLAYVKQLPVSELKIDRAFVKEVVESEVDAMIVRSTVELAHSMGFKVVGEGVETQAVSDKLQQLGVDYAQGYFYAKPLPLAEFSRWLNSYKAKFPHLVQD